MKSSAPPNARSSLRKVATQVTSADYELGCAAREAELAAQPNLSAELTNLMRDCIKLRTRIEKEIGDA